MHQGIPYVYLHGAFLVAQRVKNLPAMQETLVPSLGGEDPLKEEMTTHSSIWVDREFSGQRSLAIVHGVSRSATR